MGSGCSRNTNGSPSSVMHPSTDYHDTINAELAPFLSLDSPYNINYKFTHFFEILRQEIAGAGIRKTVAYVSKIPPEQLETQRVEFWETRIEGSQESWKALRAACETSEENAIVILGAMGIKMVNQSLQLSFDREGNKYDVPAFCINEPSRYKLPEKKQVKKEDLLGKVIKVKVRGAGAGNDVKLDAVDNWTVGELKLAYARELKENNLQTHQLRFFYGGKELTDKMLVAQCNLRDEHVIQVFKRKI